MMKTGFFFFATLSLLQLAAPQPHGKRIPHGDSVFVPALTTIAGHQHHHQRHNVVWVTEVDYTTVEAANVVIYVDHEGKPVTTKTTYNNQAPPSPIQAPPSPPSLEAKSSPIPQPSSSKAQPSVTPQPEPVKPVIQPPQPPAASTPALPPVQSAEPAKSAPLPDPPKPEKSVAPAQPTKPAQPVNEPSSAPSKTPADPVPAPSSPPEAPAPGGSGFSSGISYSPYNADNSCKSTSQVASDFQRIRGYSVVRLYGTDCDQIANVIEATRGKDISLFLGIFHIDQAQDESQTIISAVNGDWGLVNAVSVGNEVVNSGRGSVGQVTAAIGQVRDILKGAGYSGPVVTVDTMVAMQANPELCHASDFCAINCHAFFDGNVLPDGAGDFVQQWADLISSAANGKTVIVTETGWPSQGEANNKAIPSKENQAAAIESIQLKLGQNVIVYNAFNDLWKVDRGDTFGAERFWGVFGDAPSHYG